MNKTLVRVISAVIMLPVFLWAIFFTGWYYIPLYILILVFSSLAVYEFIEMQKHRNGHLAPMPYLALTANFFIISIFYIGLSRIINAPSLIAQPFMWAWVAVFIFFFFAFIVQIFARDIEGASQNVFMSVMPIIYITIPLALVFSLRNFDVKGLQAILMAAASAFAADSGAYFAGIFFGKHKGFISVSPNKSIEGYIGGIVLNIIVMALATYVFEALFMKSYFSMLEGAILGAVLAVTGQVGDLLESALKRDCQVKDSGTLIPGHGGILDLIDATLINLPLMWIYLNLVQY